MSKPNERNLGVRLDAETTARLSKFEQTTGVEGTTLARNCILAGLNYFEENGSITFPVEIVSLRRTNISDRNRPGTWEGDDIAEQPAAYRTEKSPKKKRAS